MSDPERLLDGEDELELALLRSARADAPARGSRQKALVALGLGVGTSAVTAKATAAAGAATAARATTLSLVKWLGIGILGGATTIGIVETVAPPRPAAPAAAPAPSRLAPPSLTPYALAPALPAASASAAVARPETPRPPVVAMAAPSASAEPTLADEVAALDRAREAVASGDSTRALDALDRYQRQFPSGVLRPEATVLRIEALVAAGDRPGARRLGQAFLERNPGSPHAARVRSLIGAPSIP